MADFRVCLSPSNQDGNPYASGGVTEADVCGLIAKAAQVVLDAHGVKTICPHLDGMAEKCRQSDAFGANLHVPIHTNASVPHTAVGTRCYCSAFGSPGHEAAKAIWGYLAPLTPTPGDCIKEAPGWYEIATPAAWTAYVEVDFHDVPSVAEWLIKNATACGEAIAHGILDYFGIAWDGSHPAPAPAPEPAPETGGKVRHRVIVEGGRIGSFADADKATALLEQLSALGVTARIETVQL